MCKKTLDNSQFFIFIFLFLLFSLFKHFRQSFFRKSSETISEKTRNEFFFRKGPEQVRR